jgi:hypothetical protein
MAQKVAPLLTGSPHSFFTKLFDKPVNAAGGCAARHQEGSLRSLYT